MEEQVGMLQGTEKQVMVVKVKIFMEMALLVLEATEERFMATVRLEDIINDKIYIFCY